MYGVRRCDNRFTSPFINWSSSSSLYLLLSSSEGTTTAAISSVPSFAPPSLETPKTQTSARDIPLTAAILEHIDAQMRYWGFTVIKMDQYLFCDETGGVLKKERVQAEIDRIIKRIRAAGYDFPRITSHVFRHTFATRAIEAGMQPQVLKTILGHSSLAMTMDLYSHVLPDTKAEEMQKIISMF